VGGDLSGQPDRGEIGERDTVRRAEVDIGYLAGTEKVF
jgi:hypothetical protein